MSPTESSIGSSSFVRAAARAVFFITMAVGAALITHGSLLYFSADDIHPFVHEKLPLPFESVWLLALQAHVVAAAFALPACLLMMSRRLLRAAPRVHRIVGRVTGVVVLLALVPTGGYLALFATGGWPSTLGFLLSGAIVLVAMMLAILRARAGDFRAHRRWVMHVVAQLSVAVTSRALLVGFNLAELDPEQTYVVALWLPVVVSAWLAERLANHRPRRPEARTKGQNMKRLLRLTTASLTLALLLAAPSIAAPDDGPSEPARSDPAQSDPAQSDPAQSDPALSNPAPANAAVIAAVEKGLTKPLRRLDTKTSLFSRARRPPAQRRVRVLDAKAITDAEGGSFQTFSVDTRYSRSAKVDWVADSIVGCVYDDGKIYVKRGDSYVSARVLLRKKAKRPPASVCRAADGNSKVALSQPPAKR